MEKILGEKNSKNEGKIRTLILPLWSDGELENDHFQMKNMNNIKRKIFKIFRYWLSLHCHLLILQMGVEIHWICKLRWSPQMGSCDNLYSNVVHFIILRRLIIMLYCIHVDNNRYHLDLVDWWRFCLFVEDSIMYIRHLHWMVFLVVVEGGDIDWQQRRLFCELQDWQNNCWQEWEITISYASSCCHSWCRCVEMNLVQTKLEKIMQLPDVQVIADGT